MTRGVATTQRCTGRYRYPVAPCDMCSNACGAIAYTEVGNAAFLGNSPQAFSHVGLISSGINLSRAIAREAT